MLCSDHLSGPAMSTWPPLGSADLLAPLNLSLPCPPVNTGGILFRPHGGSFGDLLAVAPCPRNREAQMFGASTLFLTISLSLLKTVGPPLSLFASQSPPEGLRAGTSHP